MSKFATIAIAAFDGNEWLPCGSPIISTKEILWMDTDCITMFGAPGWCEIGLSKALREELENDDGEVRSRYFMQEPEMTRIHPFYSDGTPIELCTKGTTK